MIIFYFIPIKTVNQKMYFTDMEKIIYTCIVPTEILFTFMIALIIIKYKLLNYCLY